MFEQTFVQPQGRTRNPWTVAVSLSLQCLVVALILLIPLLHPAMLRIPDPPPPHLLSVWIAQPPVPVQRSGSRAATSIAAPAITRPFVYVPPSAHTAEVSHVDAPSIDSAFTGWSGPLAESFGLPLSTGTVLPPRIAAQPAPQQTVAKATPSGPLRVSGGVEAAQLFYSPHPAYPQLAKAARSQGDVRLEAIIAADGSIRNLRFVSGPPLLVPAAMEAVRQWRYHPTLLNGVAVEVLTEIDINFTLSK